VGKPTGFFEFKRNIQKKRPIQERIGDFSEYYLKWNSKTAHEQGARCMNCAIPFCHNACPLGNRIPDWNHLVYEENWPKALDSLHSTNNFPEFTGRICPAPCEASCTLSINQDPVSIEHIEKTIVDFGWEKGLIKPIKPSNKTGKRVAIVGSGPAGLAAAQQLNRCGHAVTLFERDEYIGGLLRLGIPDFKLEKNIVQRRVDQMKQEGVKFVTNTNVGKNFPTKKLLAEYDAICLTGGSTHPRDLPIPGRDLSGVHFAMEYLTQQNRINAGHSISSKNLITAKDKNVIILGGGDTGADCLGTAHRQGAKEVYQLELLPEPPKERPDANPWPQWPMILRSSPAHEEGGVRDYNILTKKFSGISTVKKLHGVKIEWTQQNQGRPTFQEKEKSDFVLNAELVLLAMGFIHPEHDGLLTQLKVEFDERGNVKTDQNKMTNIKKVFSAGDMSRGQSLVVWALAEGRELARGVDEFLMGSTSLERVLIDN
tara:strand:- start:1197 stop:2648 length:1452 start_codon:yes stop_codon:yes gene_type:complete